MGPISNSYDFSVSANSMEEFWMPFTQQRAFKKNPRMVVSAKGMYYQDVSGRQILDGSAGMWCVNAGHDAQRVKEAMRAQMEVLDFAPAFRYGHPTAFRAASQLVGMMPDPISHVFFSNSGSEAVDTALKMALAYHRARGEGARRLFIGRERAYHGVGFGGISVGGIPYNRASFGQLLPNIDHLPVARDFGRNGISKGQPEHGADLADALEDLIYMHDPSNVAAVIVEPVAGSTGVLPPPKGYLERLRDITRKHGILLIFDEVITGFGRLGTASAAQYFNIDPDILITAKGMTNGAMPMGGTFVAKPVYEALMQGPEEVIELYHGYTYSGHPLAAAAAIGTADTYREERIFEHAARMSSHWETALHSLCDEPHIKDLRNLGVLAGIELHPGKKGEDLAMKMFYELWEKGLMLRPGAPNSLALSPPLILTENHIDEIFTKIRSVLHNL